MYKKTHYNLLYYRVIVREIFDDGMSSSNMP